MSQDQEITRIRLISRGAHDDVFEVRIGTGTICAAKYIRLPVQPDGTDTADRLRLKVNSMQYLRQLDHSNLVKVLGVQMLHIDTTIVVLMELISGQSLKDRIRKTALSPGGGLPEVQIRHYAKQICSAMDYLHNLDNHVVHRNISSSTVMVTERNDVKLVDYGISIQLLGETSAPRSDSARGFPHYMAPELLQDGEEGCKYSRDSDIWAFGCLVYEMATGKRPHDDCRNMKAIIKRVQEQGAPDLPTGIFSDAIRSFYAACVAPDRRGRTSAIALLNHEFLV